MSHIFGTLFVLVVAIFRTAAYTPLTDESLRGLPSAGADFDIRTGIILAPILIPRVPGTAGSIAVQDHITNFFITQLPRWGIELHNFTARNPATGNKTVPFVNIIVTRDPPWAKVGDVGRLTLAAHYDSKKTPRGFVGATDSAAPCAMLMQVARSLDEALARKWAAMESDGIQGREEEKGITILFLDGEEGFADGWNNYDSFYGSRSLAAKWEATPNLPGSIYPTAISSINLFVLLDLLGVANPRVPSYFESTNWAHENLATIESRMRKLGLAQSGAACHFLPEIDKALSNIPPPKGIQDDHVAFMERGVKVLHPIPKPFPDVWHTMNDDAEHLDLSTMEDWAKMVTAFVGEWMDLEGYMLSSPEAQLHFQIQKSGLSAK